MTVSRWLQAIVITMKKMLALLNQIILCYDKEKTLELNEAAENLLLLCQGFIYTVE